MAQKLDILMRIFHASGKDLADYLHVDNSLVSKWRNGKRPLKEDSFYTSRIAAYALEQDEKYQYARIRSLLLGDYAGVEGADAGQLADFLRQWLSSARLPSHTDIQGHRLIENSQVQAERPDIYMFRGNDGGRQVVSLLLSAAEQLGCDVEIVTLTNATMNWLYEDEDFTKAWITQHQRLLDKGCPLQLFFPVSNPHAALGEAMLKNIPMYMHENAVTHYLPRYKDDNFFYSFMLLRRHAVFYSFSANLISDNDLYYLSFDPRVVETFENLVPSFFRHSKTLFNRYHIDTYNRHYTDFVGIQESGEPQYHWYRTFPLLLMSPSSVDAVMEENELTAAERTQFVERYFQVEKLRTGCANRCFVDLKQMSLSLEQEQIALTRFSFLCGRPIKISRTLFLRLLRESLQKLALDNAMELGLKSMDSLSDIIDVEILVKENISADFRCVYNNQPIAMTTHELTCVNALYSMFDSLWSTIPHKDRSKDHVLHRMSELISTAEKTDAERRGAAT